ncbi:TldD/PmbA family protein [Aminomonas paucivorans]|uniref:TldD/PmbA family protein n=1 Tax=Aminomonas paucivorans TaxID=81412 RepID=UPI0033246E97
MSFFPSRGEVESLGEWLLDAARSTGVAEADLIYSTGESHSLELRDGEPEDQSSGVSQGIGLRTLDGQGRQGVAYANALDRRTLLDLVQWSWNNCRRGEPREGIALGRPEAPGGEPLPLEDPSMGGLTPQERTQRCLRMTEAAREADPRVVSVRGASWHDGWGESFYASTAGHASWERGTFAGCSAAVVLQEGDQVEMGGFGEQSRRLADLQEVSIARKAVDRTRCVLGGEPVPTGTYTLILDPEVAASLVDEVGDLFCVSNVHKNRSLMKGRLGHPVASPAVFLEDQGRIPWGIGSSLLDGEGVPTGRTVLVEGGVARGFLYNLEYARRDGVSSTGNACRSLSSLPDVGTTNLVLLPGTDSPKTLLRGVSRGVYVTELLGLHTLDPVSGEFSLGVKGWAIGGGEPRGPVGGVTMAGNLVDFLQRIVAVGNDLTFFGSVGACTVVVDHVAVAGS